MSLPDEDKKMQFRQEYLDEMAMMLGGYAAEQLIFGDITTGASSDLQKATRVARSLVTRFGMSEKLGPRTYGERGEMIFLGKEIHENRDYSEKTAETIDSEILTLIAEAFERAKDAIVRHRKLMDTIVEELLEKETIEKEAFEKIVGEPKKMPKLKIQPA